MVTITVVEIEGSPEELSGLDIQRLLHHRRTGSGGNEILGPVREAVGQVPEGLTRYIKAKAGPEEAGLFLRFLGEVLQWTAVTWREGAPGRDGAPRYALLHRVPQYKGAFVYVKPQQRQLLFRLLSNVADSSPLVTTRKGRSYQVQVGLSSEAALEKALELARLAYDRAGPEN